MHLTPGTRIGNYEVVSALGAGGMGEVYRARDLRLDRTVAIKALPPAFAREPERLARFEREARLLASLDHPNIAGIHGIEDSGGAPYLVLELVEGETLAQRLARGPLGARETLEIGAQIAAAIEAAHERDVVHRDLKPGNVMFSTSGVAKVLDFGLAKGGASTAAGAGGSLMPTAPALATADGIILGTAPYMSPEQARGQLVDRRTDVWAFGCVLYECLSGRQAFAGDTVSDVIARILEREPDWSAIPAATPTRLRELVKRCLTKEVKDRPRDIGDLRRELTSIAQELSAPASGIAPATTPSLAVLYFENLASDQESEYFCAGITEDILTDLSKIKGLRVASRNAVARYRGAPVDISRVAAELGVGAVLEGSVRRAGERVRITTQLINAADGFHLWAERYDRTLQDVFAVQEEIASSIATALRVALTPAESANLAKDRPNDVRAYDLYLKGRAQYGRYTAESLRQALELFHQAIAIDPNYALAWAGIADCHGQMVQWGATQDREETLRLGLEAARRAITLNPGLPEAHKAEGLVLSYMGDREGQRRAIARALEANPRFTPALINMAVERFSLADLAGAERLVRRTLEVDPHDAFATTWLAVLTGLTRRDEEMTAIAGALRKLSSDPFYVTASWFFRVWAALHHGDVAAAGQLVHDSAADDVEPANLRAMEALVAARSGRAGEAKAMLPELERAANLGGRVLLLAAETALLVGESDRALRFMARPVILDMAPIMMRLEPAVHPLLDLAPFAPRRWDGALVWPLEAPMIDVARHGLFREVRVESGRPQGSDPLVGGAAARATSSSL